MDEDIAQANYWNLCDVLGVIPWSTDIKRVVFLFTKNLYTTKDELLEEWANNNRLGGGEKKQRATETKGRGSSGGDGSVGIRPTKARVNKKLVVV